MSEDSELESVGVPAGAGVRRPVIKVTAQGPSALEDWLAVEEPLELRLNGSELLVLMRTPGHDNQLAMGFALSEGLATELEQIRSIQPPRDEDPERVANVLDLEIDDCGWAELQAARRAIFASTSCGLCGKTSIASVRLSCEPVLRPTRLTRRLVNDAPQQLRWGQPLFALSGGLHAAGIFSSKGHLLALCEDVGRHNACDKVIGRCATESDLPWPLEDEVLVVSGRASFEIVQKARMVGLGSVVAVSAASSLAVDFAREMNMTLVGFARGSDFVVYTGQVEN